MIKGNYRYEKFKKSRLDMDANGGPTQIWHNGQKSWWSINKRSGPQIINAQGWKRWDLAGVTTIQEVL